MIRFEGQTFLYIVYLNHKNKTKKNNNKSDHPFRNEQILFP